MTELFNELAIVGDAIDDEDRVVYLLASLPDSFIITLKNRVLITFTVPVLNVYVTQLNTVLLVCNYIFLSGH